MTSRPSKANHRYPNMRGAPRTREVVTEKPCARCGVTKLVAEFNVNRSHRDGRASWCKSCNAENLREWSLKNESRKRRLTFASHLRKSYGIDLSAYDQMLAAQGGVCAICAEPCRVKARLSVDHCHSSGQVRGLLCDDCNNALGRLKDRPSNLTASLLYLAKNGVTLSVEERDAFISAYPTPLSTPKE